MGGKACDSAVRRHDFADLMKLAWAPFSQQMRQGVSRGEGGEPWRKLNGALEFPPNNAGCKPGDEGS